MGKSDQGQITVQDIQEAQKRLSGVIYPTPTLVSESASKMLSREVYFKFENQQRTGSFKSRGSINKIFASTLQERKAGVIASSAGNHAQGVALGAQLAEVPATIVMPEGASLTKVEATKSYGAEVILHGLAYDDADQYARQLAVERSLMFVHPYEDLQVIAGQGTVALEILQQVPDLESVVVAVGGGGLIAGVGAAIKALRPQCRVIGVQSERAPGMTKLFAGGDYQPPTGRVSTIADGIAVKKPSRYMFDHFVSRYVDEMVTVTDDEIADAIVYVMEKTKNLVEGAGAAAVAAMMHRQLNLGKKTCAILCGGNIDLSVIAKVLERGLLKQGRLAEISVVVSDQPGILGMLTKVLADQRCNILEVRHDRVERGLALNEAKVEFLIETSGAAHVQQVQKALLQAGFRLLG